LIPDKAAPPQHFGVVLAVIAASIVLVAVIGLLIISFFVSEVLGKPAVSAEAYVFLMVLTLALFGIEAMLIKQLSKLLGVYLDSGKSVPLAKRNLPGQQTYNQLIEPRQNLEDVGVTTQFVNTDTDKIPRSLPTEETLTRKFESDE
jgi:hypothetical protein